MSLVTTGDRPHNCSPADLSYIINHARDTVLIIDADLLPTLEQVPIDELVSPFGSTLHVFTATTEFAAQWAWHPPWLTRPMGTAPALTNSRACVRGAVARRNYASAQFRCFSALASAVHIVVNQPSRSVQELLESPNWAVWRLFSHLNHHCWFNWNHYCWFSRLNHPCWCSRFNPPYRCSRQNHPCWCSRLNRPC
jgi:hypothetical protein